MYKARVYHIMIGTPSDIKKEVDIVKDALHKWNDLNSQKNRIVLLPKHWATSTYPKSGARPQESINHQLVENSDLLISIFGSRLGAPTGKALSGTIEEIDEHRKAGKPVMVFFKHSGDIYGIDPDQLRKIQEYIVGDCQEKGRDKQQIADLIENEDDLNMLFAISCADAKAILGVWGVGILGRKKSFAEQIMKLKHG